MKKVRSEEAGVTVYEGVLRGIKRENASWYL